MAYDENGIYKLLEKLKDKPGYQDEMKSRKFWRTFGIKDRKTAGIERVKDALLNAGIKYRLPQGEFGSEDLDYSKITLTRYSIITPEHLWFENIASKSYESEMEAIIFFVTPLFVKLGFKEDDFAFDRSIKILTQKITMRPDLVIYDGESRLKENILAVVEAKKFPNDPLEQEKILSKAQEEALVYSSLLRCRYSIATDGDELIVFSPRTENGEGVRKFNRKELKKKWNSLYLLLSRDVLINESK